jgi:hypothetical protein
VVPHPAIALGPHTGADARTFSRPDKLPEGPSIKSETKPRRCRQAYVDEIDRRVVVDRVQLGGRGESELVGDPLPRSASPTATRPDANSQFCLEALLSL